MAVCSKPGEVAEKSSVTFGEPLLERTGKALGRQLTLTDYDPKPFEGPKQPVKGKHVSFGEKEGEEEEEMHEEPASAPAVSEVRRSGDDLGDDFLIDDQGGKKDKKRKKGY